MRFAGHILPALIIAGAATAVHGENEMTLGSLVGEFNSTLNVPFTLSTTDEVEGFVAVVEVDTARLILVDVLPVPELDPDDPSGPRADTVIVDFSDDHLVLGVVMNSNPSDNGGVFELLGPGDNLPLAEVVVRCGLAPDTPTREIVTEMSFVDGKFAALGPEPLLDNIVVVGGRSIGATDGLVLTPGVIRCVSAPERLIIEDGESEFLPDAGPPAGEARILMDNNSDVEGFVTVICHDPAVLSIERIELGTDALEADFFEVEQEPRGAAFGVVLDLLDPQKAPPRVRPGRGRHIATYRYRCVDPPADVDLTTGLSFCDDVIGQPLKENLVVVGGESITRADGLSLQDGSFVCRGVTEFENETGLCNDGVDNDGDGLVDIEDPDCPFYNFEVVDPETLEPAVVQGSIGVATRALLAFRSPLIRDVGGAGDSLHGAVQGFSLGFEHECDEISFEETFDVAGTILEAVGTEFITLQADNTSSGMDGDGCSVVIAVLLDSLPPFDGQVIPALEMIQPLGFIQFTVREGVPCGGGLKAVARDGVNGRGNVPVLNLMAVDNLPMRALVRPIDISVAQPERFYRGDCNYSLRSQGIDPVQLSDAAAVISFLFLDNILKFDPPCLDACDGNDDGRVDLADAVAILNFLFIPGTSVLPDPGPGFDDAFRPIGPGTDPTKDPLDCRTGVDCDIEG